MEKLERQSIIQELRQLFVRPTSGKRQLQIRDHMIKEDRRNYLKNHYKILNKKLIALNIETHMIDKNMDKMLTEICDIDKELEQYYDLKK
jgi:hypothetical protein